MYLMTAYTALAEPSRRRILDLLRNGERSVNDLVARLELSQPGVSKQLKVLREAGLVEVRPDEHPALVYAPTRARESYLTRRALAART